jgi:hypothetical protein
MSPRRWGSRPSRNRARRVWCLLDQLFECFDAICRRTSICCESRRRGKVTGSSADLWTIGPAVEIALIATANVFSSLMQAMRSWLWGDCRSSLLMPQHFACAASMSVPKCAGKALVARLRACFWVAPDKPRVRSPSMPAPRPRPHSGKPSAFVHAARRNTRTTSSLVEQNSPSCEPGDEGEILAFAVPFSRRCGHGRRQ